VADVVTNALVQQIRPGRSKVVLGARERQVLKLVALGHTSYQIAAQLLIAASTVEVHRRNIMRKLDRHSVAELTRMSSTTSAGTAISHYASVASLAAWRRSSQLSRSCGAMGSTEACP
jgi:DNA-binding CsgD family transcriptional regulator